MGRFTGVLFASDFDHTISGMDGKIPEKNLEAIRAFIAEGGVFSVASGRGVPLFRHKASLLPINAPCILYNGAACYDYRTEEYLFTYAMPQGAQEILEILKARYPAVRIEVQTPDACYVFGYDPLRDLYLERAGVPYFYAGDRPIPAPWLKIVVYGKFRRPEYDSADILTPEDIARFDEIERTMRTLSGGRFSVARSMGRIVECWASGCDKGSSARELAGRLGCTLLAAAGDAPNDIPLLQEADAAFCPEDCDPSLGAYPFHRVAPCGEGAVAEAIARLDALRGF